MSKLRQANAHAIKTQKRKSENLSQLTPGKKRYVKRELGDERPTIWIGKSGISDTLIKEVEKQLDKRKMVKIKILQSAIGEHNAKQIASQIATQSQALLVETRGHTFMLYKPKKK